MSRSKAKRRAVKRRHYVNKNRERVKPSPLAEAKKRPWQLLRLLESGPSRNGISPEQFEAALDIVAGSDALTQFLDYRSSSMTTETWSCDIAQEMTWAQARQAAMYIGYAHDLAKRLRLRARHVVDIARDDRLIVPAEVPTLIKALDLWLDHRDDWDVRPLTRRDSALQSPTTIPYGTTPPGGWSAVAPPPPPRANATAPTAAPRAVAQAARRA